jgi:uracil-DNA glycosylase
MSHAIDTFIEKLAAAEVAEDAFNQYGHADPHNAIRRDNLRLYLAQMAARDPKVLLVGEAPGYQGCRRSGVPFTSDFILLNPPDGVPILGEAAGYRMSPEYGKPRKEPSATIVWETIGQTGLVPLIFSAYPFHPFRSGKALSNRAPRASELEAGRPYLSDVLSMFDFEVVMAVGNTAEKSLAELDIEFVKLRHPSHGGKAEFVAGFAAVAERFV